MNIFPVKVGDAVEFSKTIAESDVYLFAGITGDFSPHHVNEEFMRNSSYKRRIAHGALVVGFMSSASSMLIAKFTSASADWFPVSLGYDRIRFIEPVFIGDTLTVAYTITAFNEARHRTTADILVTNQIGKSVALAQHILKWNTTTHDKPSDGAS
jgi:3-hydroxybutyryl-CoA dehydratase